MMTHRFPL